MINLDTHMLVDAIEGLLTPAEHNALEPESWCISAIVLWEIEMLSRARRIRLSLESPALANVLDQVQIIAIDSNIARAIRRLDFRSDPADELISATSVQLNVPLATRDALIHGSRVVPLVRM
ncbi:MAG TPA: PIN domain-containing protein [Tepidiformaceae bacterium]|nr:PIN domain-containing protein [Tepidiformaceae bacterium]